MDVPTQILIFLGNLSSSLNLLGTPLTHPENALLCLAAIGLLVAWRGDSRLISRPFLYVAMATMSTAWILDQGSSFIPLLPSAALMIGLAIWTGQSMVKTRRLQYKTGNEFNKPTWLFYLATVLLSSLAMGLSQVFVYFFGDSVKPSASFWPRMADMGLWVSYTWLWAAASITALAMVAFYTLLLIRRHGHGKSYLPMSC